MLPAGGYIYIYIYILTDWRVQGFTNEERDQRPPIHLEDLHKNGKNHFMSGTRVPTARSKDKRLILQVGRDIYISEVQKKIIEEKNT